MSRRTPTPGPVPTPQLIRQLPGYKTFTPTVRSNLVTPETLRPPAVYTLPTALKMHTAEPAVRHVQGPAGEITPPRGIPLRDYWKGYRVWVAAGLTAGALLLAFSVAWGWLEVRAADYVLDREQHQHAQAWERAREVVPILASEGVDTSPLEVPAGQTDAERIAQGRTFREQASRLAESLPPDHAHSRLVRERMRELYVAETEYQTAVDRQQDTVQGLRARVAIALGAGPD